MENPLVSIGVITYNSATTIVETLDSAYQQTYENLELIISDDCSSDDTVVICKKWLESYGHRFVNTKIVTVPVNTGTSANCNRAIVEAQGEWFKGIAGDDMLMPDAIEEYMRFVLDNPQCQMCVAGVKVFSTENIPTEQLSAQYNQYLKNTDISLEEQKRQIVKKMIFPGPTYFYSKKLCEAVGGYDERYILSEEWAFCYKVLNEGYRINVIHKPLVKYRLTSSSICRDPKAKYGNPIWVLDNRSFFLDVRLKEMLKRGMFLSAYIQWVDYTKRYLFIKKGDSLHTKIGIFLLDMINPSTYYSFIKKFLCK